MLKGQRVTVRHMIESDIPAILDYQGSVAAQDPFFTGSKMESPSEIRKRLLQDGYATEASEKFMVLDETQQVIGSVRHYQGKPYSGAREVGWAIYKTEHRRKGYAFEAVRLLVDYLFETQPFHRLECCASQKNLASVMLAEKIGFLKEGLLRGLLFARGGYEDAVIMGILREDWEKVRTTQR